MQTDRNDMKVEKSVSMHLHAFEQLCKRQIVTDLNRATHYIWETFFEKLYTECDVETIPRPFSKELKLSISVDQ